MWTGPKDGTDPSQGFSSWVAGARFTTGYLPLRNVPAVPIRDALLQPYKRCGDARLPAVADRRGVGKDGAGLRRVHSLADAATVAADAPTPPPRR